MSVFSDYCNEKMGTQRNGGLMRFDNEVKREVRETVFAQKSVIVLREIHDIVSDFLDIQDERMEKLANARMMLVISKMLQNIRAPHREIMKSYFDEEIPDYYEAQMKYDELNLNP